jgi:hypothetical protein
MKYIGTDMIKRTTIEVNTVEWQIIDGIFENDGDLVQVDVVDWLFDELTTNVANTDLGKYLEHAIADEFVFVRGE